MGPDYIPHFYCNGLIFMPLTTVTSTVTPSPFPCLKYDKVSSYCDENNHNTTHIWKRQGVVSLTASKSILWCANLPLTTKANITRYTTDLICNPNCNFKIMFIVVDLDIRVSVFQNAITSCTWCAESCVLNLNFPCRFTASLANSWSQIVVDSNKLDLV